MNLYCGIDPGQSGAIAVVKDNGEAEVFRLDNTERDVWIWLQTWIEDFTAEIAFAFLEKVGSMPKQGVASTFKFGVSYGFCRGILTAAGIPWDTVTPAKWMGHMKVRRPAGASETKHKNIRKAAAQRLFPQLTITHHTADALLLAEYCRRLKSGG